MISLSIRASHTLKGGNAFILPWRKANARGTTSPARGGAPRVPVIKHLPQCRGGHADILQVVRSMSCSPANAMLLLTTKAPKTWEVNSELWSSETRVHSADRHHRQRMALGTEGNSSIHARSVDASVSSASTPLCSGLRNVRCWNACCWSGSPCGTFVVRWGADSRGSWAFSATAARRCLSLCTSSPLPLQTQCRGIALKYPMAAGVAAGARDPLVLQKARAAYRGARTLRAILPLRGC